MQIKKVLLYIVSISPWIFVAATFVIGLMTPGYNHFSMTVSRLSLGSYGWLQSINLIFFAVMLFIASNELTLNARHIQIQNTLRRTFLLTAVTLILLAVFPTDPIDTFPKQLLTISWNAFIHFFVVGVYILITPLGILLLTQTFKLDSQFRRFVFFTFMTGFTAFTLSIVWSVFFYFGILDPYRGLFQKIIILEVLIWLSEILRELFLLDGR